MTDPKQVLTNIRKRPLYFDLETEVHPRIGEWIKKEEPDLASARAPSNYKDPLKIGAYIRKAQEEMIANSLIDYQDRLSKAPLDADYGAIRAIGYRQGPDETITVMIVPRDRDSFAPLNTFGKDHLVETVVFDTEADMIRTFWQLFAKARKETVSYNGIQFDFPYLMRRSMDLQVGVTTRPDLRRYQLKGNLDLMQILYNWGRAKGMKFVCERYGIENPNPVLDGSMVADMDDATLVQYAAGDIYMLTELHRLMTGVYI